MNRPPVWQWNEPPIDDATIGHIAKEYSTLDWIMEGLLTRAGFAIRRVLDFRAPLIQYLCEAERSQRGVTNAWTAVDPLRHAGV